jgi:uncharacterized protein YycO
MDTANSEQHFNQQLVSIIKQYPVLIEKSQLPGAKVMKAKALVNAKLSIATNTGKAMDEKQILKKIANMKAQVKKKTDAMQTGNKKIVLVPWEKDLYNIFNGDENPTISKMPCAISVGFKPSTSTAPEVNQVRTCYSNWEPF